LIFSFGIQEFKESRAMNIEALIGNILGYVGLCLGFNLLNVPTFLQTQLKKLNNYVKSMSKKQNRVIKIAPK
jgi:hypothetical protein